MWRLTRQKATTSVGCRTFLDKVRAKNKKYLPPANEVWGKVIFFTSVCQEFCPQGRRSALGGGVAWSQGGACSGGVCSQGVCSGGPWSRGCLVETPPRTATHAGGTHPTGMHSYWVTKHNLYIYLQPQDERQDRRTGRPCGTGTP